MTMSTLTYQVSFNTPAFLGNAEQQAQWRTPPFKALLRQWWRVVKAPDVGYDHHELLRRENALFGSAGASDADSTGGGRSKVQLRLSGWDAGSIQVGKDSVELKYVDHDEVDPRTFSPYKGEKKVRADVYLGYGPIGRSSAIADAIAKTLHIRFPIEFKEDLLKAVQLAAWFGSIGSRSRNGWGSLHIEGESLLAYEGLSEHALLNYAAAQPLANALRLDWGHGFSQRQDGRLAIWRVGKIDLQNKSMEGFGSWREAMEELARIKIGFRTALKFPQEASPHSKVQDRHVLAYPVTHHKIRGVDDQKRLTNSLRFKVHRHGTKFYCVIAHMPCAMPESFMTNPPDVAFQHRVWSTVYQHLSTQFPERVTSIKKGAP